jgi:hypothetical protein
MYAIKKSTSISEIWRNFLKPEHPLPSKILCTLVLFDTIHFSLNNISTMALRDKAVDLFQYKARLNVRDAFKIRTGN